MNEDILNLVSLSAFLSAILLPLIIPTTKESRDSKNRFVGTPWVLLEGLKMRCH